MTTTPEESQIPQTGPLSSLEEDQSFYGEVQYLDYGGARHLRKAYRIPIDLLHFNIENGRYATKFSLLRGANPGVNINPRESHWRNEILKMLNGTWEDTATGVNTHSDQSHFQDLTEDIEQRGQERTGIVLEDGGVMSGNRRLAALITLSNQHPDADRYRYLHAFIVPGEGVSPADTWRLEMSAQMGQGRLLRDYDPVERLIKIREGVRLLMQTNIHDSEEAAIRVVANDFGSDAATIRKDLQSLKHIDNYLNAIGRPDHYWLAKDLTEVFTEWEPLEQSMRVNSMPLTDRLRLRTGVYFLIHNAKADFRLLRDIRGAVGPARRRRDAQSVPAAVEAITANAPDPQLLEGEPTEETQDLAAAMRDQFRAEYQAGRPGSVLSKAQRGEANLRAVKEALEVDPAPSGSVTDQLRQSLMSASEFATESLGLL
ncbi:MAG: hypothetical protein F4W93_13090 [Dehalococcoidia bacterium]|nr:hypothetical protein [Dehalococcoidia bacterium]